MEDSLPMTPMNHRAKFDAASFILGGEISNRTNTQTNKQTVTDISTPCLSAIRHVKRRYEQLYVWTDARGSMVFYTQVL